MSSDNLITIIATTLGETDVSAHATIGRLVEALGKETARDLLANTLRIEADGGIQTDDKTRRRTPGGVFFKLAKDATTPKQRRDIFGPTWAKKPKMEPLSWEAIKDCIDDILVKPGDTSTVKISIVGKPGRIIEKGNVVITSMQNSQPPSLPKGLPSPPSDKTTYVVYIAIKQWRKIKDALKNPEDKLIIEGYPVFDRRIGQTGAMTIYAQSATTMMVQRQVREAQRAAK